MTVNFWIYAWLIFLWKYKSFKPLHMSLSSELIKNLHTATFASMLMKGSGCCMKQQVVRFLYASISLGYIEAENGFFLSILRLSNKYTMLIKKECSFPLIYPDVGYWYIIWKVNTKNREPGKTLSAHYASGVGISCKDCLLFLKKNSGDLYFDVLIIELYV